MRWLVLLVLLVAVSSSPAWAQEATVTPELVVEPTATPELVVEPTATAGSLVEPTATRAPVLPTVVPDVTACAVNGACGSAVVVVGHADGSQGAEYLIVAVLLFGFGGLIVLRVVDIFVVRRA